MMRTTPTKNVGVMGRFEIAPEDAVGFYMESAQQNKNFIKPPNYDIPGTDTIELLAFQNDQEHKTMLRLQKQLTGNSNRQEQVNKMYIRDINKMLTELRHGFIETNAFLKMCNDKKQQAKQTVLSEQKQQEELRRANVKRIGDIKALTGFKGDLLHVVNELEPYEKVIQQVVAENEHRFSSVKDCMDRCDAMILTNVEIDKMMKEKLELIQIRQKAMIKLCREAALRVLKYMNELAALKRDYEKASCDCLKWQKILIDIKNCVDENRLVRKRMTEGINAMFSLLCQRRGLDSSKLAPVTRQLDFIRDEVKVLQKVFDLCQTDGDH